MQLPQLQKLVAAPERMATPQEYLSAVWQVAGQPWILIGRWKLPEASGWRIFVQDFSEQYPGQDLAAASKLKQQLAAQVFKTRKEALQALVVALEI